MDDWEQEGSRVADVILGKLLENEKSQTDVDFKKEKKTAKHENFSFLIYWSYFTCCFTFACTLFGCLEKMNSLFLVYVLNLHYVSSCLQ